MQTIEFIVRPTENRQLLQDFLAARLQLSRRGAKELLDRRDVFVNGKRVWMARHILQTGDAISVARGAGWRGARETEPLPVIFEDGRFLVVDKPAGLLSTGEEGAEGRLRAQTGNSAVAAVHRLDRDTSGCLLLARDAAAAAAAIAGFEGQAVRKMYHALVVGRVQPAEQTVRLPLEGRPAITHLKVLDANAQASHLLVRIETGRTHQIRKHLAALRHPVLGDRAYGARRALAPLLRTVERHMLHASALEWRDPYGGAWQRAQAPLPADFKAWLRRLRLT